MAKMQEEPEKRLSEVYESLLHYTNSEGLEGILSTKCLWATHYQFLNDSHELQTFIEACKSKIKFDKKVSEIDRERALNDLEKFLRHGLEQLGEFAPPFVICFSSDTKGKDDCRDKYEFLNGRLSQWRGYGKDGGYAIEFNSGILEELVKSEGDKWFYKVLSCISSVGYYHKEEGFLRDSDDDTVDALRKSLDNAVDKIIEESKKANDKNVDKEDIDIKGIMSQIVSTAPRIKHYCFHEENEVRMVFCPSTKKYLEDLKEKNPGVEFPDIPKAVNFKSPKTRDKSVPYIKLFEEVEFKELFVRSVKAIIIGPGGDQGERKTNLEMMLEKHDYGDVEIRCSDMPYVER